MTIGEGTMTRRRDFVKTLGTVALGSAWRPRAPSPESRVPRSLNRIGLELYSVRDAMHKDPDGTLAAVRAMGYTDVELLWSFGNFGQIGRASCRERVEIG